MKNSVANVIRKIGWGVIIIGIIAGFSAGWKAGDVRYMKYFFEDFVWSIALTSWIQGVVGGILLIGFSEVIEILENIKRKVNM
jgi:hypothetical protein